MSLKYISENFYVTEQISVEDLIRIQEHGIKNIICNRPDQEVSEQLQFESIKSEAEKLGITCYYLPMTDLTVSPQLSQDFKKLLESFDGSTLAYCRSGRRSSILWSAAQLNQMPINEIIEATAQAGYDLADVTKSLLNSL